MSGVEAMIREAEKSLGLSGRPNYITKWYAARNGSVFADAPWCQMSVTYWAFHTGNYDAVCFGKDYAYTVYSAQRFQEAGRWHTDTAGIRRGDIVFFDWKFSNSVGAIDHVGIVTGVNGRDILTIEGNTSDRCARRVRQADTIVGYGRPAYATVTPPPTPTPTPTEPPVYTPPPFPANLKPDSSSPSAKPLQSALKKAGYLASNVALADNYGPATQAAVKKFYTANASHGWAPDIAIGPLGWAELHREAYGSAPAPTPAPTPPPTPPTGAPGVANYLTVPEAAHNYSRVTYGGRTVNVRTRELLKLAAAWAGVTINLSQGSYNPGGVSASAGTHDGGGVVDISVNDWSTSKRSAVVLALRKAGFAAWLRTPAEGFSYHIHACAIGDREMASGAKKQVQSYFNGRNGLANNGADNFEHRWPNWCDKFRN